MSTKIVMKVKGMHCASCATLIDKLVAKQPGVIAVNASYGAEKVTVEFDETKIKLEQIDKFVNQLGYDLIRPDEDTGNLAEEEEKEAKQLKASGRRVLASFILSLPIIIYYMSVHMFNLKHVHAIGGLDLNYIYWILSTPIQFVIAWPFYRNAFTSVRVGSANMDVLVVLGTTAAYLYSTIGFLFYNIDHPFWESSAALLSFILLGRYIEARAKGKASSAIKELLKLEAKEAHLWRDNQEVTVPLNQIKVGDILIVKPGEKIPVDGIIIEGATHIDEKVVTGESMPVKKTVNEEVIGATVNQEGLIKFRATKVGKDTLLFQIVKMVEEAQASKAPIQDLVDKISEYFVPAVITIAVLSFAGWVFVAGLPFRAGLMRLIAVLVISCPCAMGLATPTALVVGIGRATKFGIILKGGAALEKAYRVNTIAFDKTGTLTEGKPIVTDMIPNGQLDYKEMLSLAAAIETGSEHPLARAVVEKGKKELGTLPEIHEFKAFQGMGIEAIVNGKKVAIGNETLVKSWNLNVDEIKPKFDELINQAKTVVYMFIDGWPAGVIAMADTLKPSAVEAIAELKRMGKELIMITGDNPKTAAAIAKQVGIDRVMAQVLPQDKEKVIAGLQAEGKIVAMVGDGINDSPALARADLGIAIGSGTDVAIETGEVILVKDDLRDVATAIALSSKTIHKVWQNLFWAFIYNVVAIPVAAGAHLLVTQSAGVAMPWVLKAGEKLGGFGRAFVNFSQATLRPEIAGFAMAFSSVSVVLNSLLLKLYTPAIEKKSKEQNDG